MALAAGLTALAKVTGYYMNREFFCRMIMTIIILPYAYGPYGAVCAV